MQLSLHIQKSIWIIQASIIAAKRNSTQCITTNDVITTAIAQVAQLIIPGLHPKIAVISHIIKAAHNHTIGFTSATKLKAMASGISASATVNPDRISALVCHFFSKSMKLWYNYALNIAIFFICKEKVDFEQNKKRELVSAFYK